MRETEKSRKPVKKSQTLQRRIVYWANWLQVKLVHLEFEHYTSAVAGMNSCGFVMTCMDLHLYLYQYVHFVTFVRK